MKKKDLESAFMLVLKALQNSLDLKSQPMPSNPPSDPANNTPKHQVDLIGTSTMNSEPDDRILLSLQNLSQDEQSATTLRLLSCDGNAYALLRYTNPNYTVMNDLNHVLDLCTSTKSNGIMLRTENPNASIRFAIGSEGPNLFERLVIESNGHVGIGTTAPKTPLHVTGGDIFIESVHHGVIMKSPNGTCWRMTVSDAGKPVFTKVNCL
jgi:hypothetical protein